MALGMLFGNLLLGNCFGREMGNGLCALCLYMHTGEVVSSSVGPYVCI